jgi:hypothetical protein
MRIAGLERRRHAVPLWVNRVALSARLRCLLLIASLHFGAAILRDLYNLDSLIIHGIATVEQEVGDALTLAIQQLLFQGGEFGWPLDEVGRRLGRHHGDALLPALILQQTDQVVRCSGTSRS